MFDDFFEILKKKPLREQIVEKSVESLLLGKQMFMDAKTSLRSDGNLDFARHVIEEDKIINKSERSIRRKLLTHFALADNVDIGSGFAISSIVIDIERIGDYAKNIADLALLTEGNLNIRPFEDTVKIIEEKIESMFDNTVAAFEKDDDDLAKAVMAMYKEGISNQCEAIKDSLIREDVKIPKKDAVSIALYVRSLKRVGAHLYNICSSIINPFPRIGFKAKE
ncbi:MAG: hypothetical protein JXQ65_16465 [Candidatus Marinimicrobia bacterium]|nr:hypothetical protein [Candidatus Neomarinimicrobiota bacterium]